MGGTGDHLGNDPTAAALRRQYAEENQILTEMNALLERELEAAVAQSKSFAAEAEAREGDFGRRATVFRAQVEMLTRRAALMEEANAAEMDACREDAQVCVCMCRVCVRCVAMVMGLMTRSAMKGASIAILFKSTLMGCRPPK